MLDLPSVHYRRGTQVGKPAILEFGYTVMGNYPTQEYYNSLVRAFKEKGADNILLDSNPRNQAFLAASVAWAIQNGLLYNDENQVGDQEEVSSFRLTEKGRREILGT